MFYKIVFVVTFAEVNYDLMKQSFWRFEDFEEYM